MRCENDTGAALLALHVSGKGHLTLTLEVAAFDGDDLAVGVARGVVATQYYCSWKRQYSSKTLSPLERRARSRIIGFGEARDQRAP